VDLGAVACATPGFNPSGANQHVIVFHDDEWPYEDSLSTLARTTVTFDVDTGEILDSDIEINEFQHRIVVSPQKGEYSLVQVLTHETGHFIGIAHTPVSAATMYYAYNASNKGDLVSDDVEAVCTIYGPDGTRAAAMAPDGGLVDGGTAQPETISASACDPTPYGGQASACDAGATDAGDPGTPTPRTSLSCTVGAAPASARPPLALFAASLLAVAGALNRRARRAGARRSGARGDGLTKPAP
jgi:hypothetical protein